MELSDEILRLSRSDPNLAEELAEDACWLAERSGDDYCRGRARRSLGHMHALRGRYPEALRSYGEAVELFERAERETEVGITLNSSLMPLSYLGRYAEAVQRAERARTIFERHGEDRRLTLLAVNLANIHFRQDRFEEALTLYRRTLDLLREPEDVQAIAVVLRNVLVCQIGLGDFSQALEAHRRARAFCLENGLTQLVMECDYNVAYLHFLQGDYSRALELFEEARQECRAAGDRYHQALCDLDEAEIYLELNLIPEAREVAGRALTEFEALGMGYEAAKALIFQAMAAGRSDRSDRSLDLFARARALFVEQENQIWPALVDYHRAALLARSGDDGEARRLAESARRFFTDTPFSSRAALCELLIAELDLKAGDTASALDHCAAAQERLATAGGAPIVNFQAEMVRGEAFTRRGQRSKAREAFEGASRILEDLRLHLSVSAFRISFFKDRVRVYSRLFALSLEGETPDPEAAFSFAETAKSRHLLELLTPLDALPREVRAQGVEGEELRRLRARLGLAYRLTDAEELGREAPRQERLSFLRQRSAEIESQLVYFLRKLEGRSPAPSGLAAGVPCAEIRSLLAPDQTLLEYFESGGRFYALVLTSRDLHVEPLATSEAVRRVLALLQFQLSKFRLRDEFLEDFGGLVSRATHEHLEELFAGLVAPIRRRLDGEHLIVVPHGPLHYVPFHALFDGGRYLIDDFAVSYAPSASVYHRCATRTPSVRRRSLVLAVSDPRAPAIEEEARAVAAALPGARVLVGDEATESALQEEGPHSRFIHLATHGWFRRDSPKFSALRLADSRLTFLDLRRLRLPSDLVVLSGCSTGLSVVEGGDELLGLASGVLSAGAQSVLVSLWDVDDRSTVAFMRSFYRELAGGSDKARSLRTAMLETRSYQQQPYYWAPFVLVGDPARVDPEA